MLHHFSPPPEWIRITSIDAHTAGEPLRVITGGLPEDDGADGEVDRNPTGTGVRAWAAIHYAKGEIELNEPFVVESILGTCFTGRAVEEAEFGPYDAVIPRVTGASYATGRNEWWIDPDDPLGEGFILR